MKLPRRNFLHRLPRAWDVDVPPRALSAALETLTIACQLARVFDCSRRAPCKGHGRNQPYRQDARIFHPRCVVSNSERGCPGFRFQSSFPGLVATVAFAWSTAAAVENTRELAGYCQSLERGAKGAGRHIYIPRTREAMEKISAGKFHFEPPSVVSIQSPRWHYVMASSQTLGD